MFEIRSAKIGDADLIIHYIKALAEAEGFTGEVSVSKNDVESKLLETDIAKALICLDDGKPCGFAVYYFTFSTTTGKSGLHLDDLYIEPEHQGKGYGKVVMQYLANIAIEHNCARFEWWALTENKPAMNFYHRIGAEELEELSLFRMDVSRMEKLIETS